MEGPWFALESQELLGPFTDEYDMEPSQELPYRELSIVNFTAESQDPCNQPGYSFHCLKAVKGHTLVSVIGSNSKACRSM